MKKLKLPIKNILLKTSLFIAVLLPLVAFVYLVGIKPIIQTPVNNNIYNNIPIDPGASQVEESTSSSSSSSLTKASFNFNKDVIFTNKVGKINFKNPASAGQSITLELSISDAELKSKIGKTGRTAEDQKKLDQENYDQTKAKVSIGKSGAIPPGYNLSTIKLLALPDGTFLPSGTYKGTVNLTLYGKETNEKAIVNSQLEVAIIVE